jgi:hypothetical protein
VWLEGRFGVLLVPSRRRVTGGGEEIEQGGAVVGEES